MSYPYSGLRLDPNQRWPLMGPWKHLYPKLFQNVASTNTMKAARYYGPGDIRVELDVPEPQPSDGQIKIKIAWNGICGSDLHAFLAPVTKFPTTTRANEITGETLPITMGHEFSGTIVELGNGVDGGKYSVGQNVVVEPLLSCMKTDSCKACAEGSRNLCAQANFIGVGGGGGGLAEYVSVDEKLVHVLPDNISLEVGACIEPLAVAWHAVKRSRFKEGDTALILGAGPIGLFILKVLRAIDPEAEVIISEPAALRRELAVTHGASLAVDPSIENVVAAAQGVDVAFDAAGIQASLDTAMRSVKPRGVVVNVAVWEQEAKVNMNFMLMREITMTGIIGYDRVHSDVIEALAAGKIVGIEDLITSRVAIENVVEKGFRVLLNDKDAQVKILIHP